MPPEGLRLRRHQLAWLHDAGWARLLDRVGERGPAGRAAAPLDGALGGSPEATPDHAPAHDQAAACLRHWAAHRLPLIVTRQPEPRHTLDPHLVHLGLPAPDSLGQLRLRLQVEPRDLQLLDECPRAEAVVASLPAEARRAWLATCRRLDALGLEARVYGSHGWQALTALDHVRPRSDVDLWLAVRDVAQADAAAATLATFDASDPRLDGELMFPDGRAVHWREWQDWRQGRARAVLVKTLHRALLVHSREAFA